ncbi:MULTISPECIES: acetoacetate--CoA ligase [Tsukamurella]|uniref:Acetoacetate--CoA ligase n=2 Tax=Tsukamurella TaxID=2060 RepID=A0A5C5S3U7_9ACTN|nr:MULTISPECIES: acetoacetate--CoA ligase [Tsukamurella]NMD55047.1 acetoacetate--CoA ligase [Tsukamurella columbiensis]TWS30077.1 acetoacetate--CoA ligase [Tsukamurella conjunctivitidis]
MHSIDRFAQSVGLPTGDYDAVYQWSVSEPEQFWGAVWDFFELGERTGPVLASREMPGARWFPEVELNYVDRVLRFASLPGAAIVGLSDDGARVEIPWSELPARVSAITELLRSLGVGVGDRVAAYLPDEPFAVLAFLATASIGAIWSGCGQDYAPEGAAGRMAQLEPKVLFARDGYAFGEKYVDKRADTAELAGLLGVPASHVITELPEPGPDTPALKPVRVPFDHPLWVLFSSGTTGKPKGIVQGHGGILVEHVKVLGLHNEIGPGDVFFWHTALSWMMWNYQVAGLLVGATIVTFSGHPLAPTADRLWQVCEDEQVTFFGTSPGQLQASRKAGLNPGTDHDLVLRTIGSTGSPLAPDLFTWVDEHVAAGLPVSSVSGGTDVCSAFCGGTASVPHVPGELTVRYLGCALEAWAPDRTPLIGEVGEMVITMPMPSMPTHFWNDPGDAKYRAAYFEHEWTDGIAPNLWRHGDWVELTDRGSITIHGRSDATLNRNGIRMGSADIYEVVEAVPEVAEAMVVGVDGPGAKYWMPMFLTLVPGAELTDELVQRIRADVRARLSPRHVPDEVIEAPGIPHTKTGKKLEIPVTGMLAGREVNVDPRSVDDPELLGWYEQQGRAHAW